MIKPSESHLLYLKTEPVEDHVSTERREMLFKLAQHVSKEYDQIKSITGKKNTGRMTLNNLKRPVNKGKFTPSEFDRFDAHINDVIIENIQKTIDKMNLSENPVNNNSKSIIQDDDDVDDKIVKRSRSKGVRVSSRTKSIIKRDVENVVLSKEVKINNIIKEVYSDIKLSNIKRQFSVFLSYIHLNKIMNSSFEDSEDRLDLIIKV